MTGQPWIGRAILSGPAHRQEFALVVEDVQPLGIEIDAVFDIADKGVLGPAVPQAGHDIEEFAGAAIALAMLHVLGHAEIERRVGVRGRDQIPAARPPLMWSSEANRRAIR